jgi:hypothetical protein
MKRVTLIGVTLGLTCVAGATNITGNIAVDNVWSVYLSTDDSVQGTLIASGGNWGTPTSINAALTPGVTNFLHIVGQNQGGPSMLIADLGLSDGGFLFANGTGSLLSNAADWQGNLTGFGSFNVTPQDLGPDGTSPWGNFAAIDDSARFIWIDTVNDSLTPNYFTVAIRPVPEPGTMAVLALGGAILLRRRVRKA